ncbi:MAG: CotH kinase family protein [Ruminococcus sp.]|nr:CotH kinase family protein [Ruminococcus sp.]
MKIKGYKRYAAFAAALTLIISSLSSCSGTSASSNNTGSTEASTSAEVVAKNLSSNTSGYTDKLFDSSYVHTIDISISEADWSDLKSNPTEKTKYETNITIDGETISSVSFATKGNTSLSSIASDKDSDRYSFKINFGKFIDGQTYYGLNKLNLNNIYADATYMKDFISYEIFRRAGVDAPLTSYVWLTVNGEVQGLYLAIEDISSSYLERTQNGDGELYKPESEMLGNMGEMKMPEGGFEFPEGMTMPEGMTFPEDMTMPEGMTFPKDKTLPEGAELPDSEKQSGDKKDPGRRGGRSSKPDGTDFSGMPEGMTMPEGMEMPGNGGFPGGMGFGGSDGADLAYKDDSIESYSDIFNNCITDADDADKQRVIAALRSLSEGSIESCIDTDEVISYFAAHNFVLNYDSYTGSMLHNYYLMEKDGKLSMLPWDYNLSFGGFGGGAPGNGGDDEHDNSATSLVNTGIDTPVSGGIDSSRPMWDWIADNEEYLQKYHEILDGLISDYFESGDFEKQIDEVYEMILPYVEKDTTAFYKSEEFKTGYSTLKEFCMLRAKSIRAQLDGTLSADTDKQEADKKIDASSVKTEDMGKQGGGKDGGMGFGKQRGFDRKSSSLPEAETEIQSSNTTTEAQ